MKTKNRITDYLIIGNSSAGLAAAEAIRENDKIKKIDIFTDEEYFNYSKPLITYYLAGKLDLNKINFKDKNFYTDNNINLNTSTKIVKVNPGDNEVITSEGYSIFYSKLLIASGGSPVIPDINVTEDNGKVVKLGSCDKKPEGIFTLTSLNDAVALKKYIKDYCVKDAVILGGGLIGLKAAEALLNLRIKLTIVELSDRILAASFDKTASEIIKEKLEEEGSVVLTSTTIDSIYISKGKIKKIKISNGSILECNLLVAAIGVRPNTELIKETKIKTDNGIVVNERMETSIDNIFATGDVTKSFDKILLTSRNIAIWPIASNQGSVAGRNMSGENASYGGGFFMNSVEILNVPVISMGLSNISEDDSCSEFDKNRRGIEIFESFNPEKYFYKKIITRKNKIVGVILLGAIERAGIYAGLINNKIDISGIKNNILKDDFGIIQLPEDYRKHLVVGEGIEV